jgi:hypothetical protein
MKKQLIISLVIVIVVAGGAFFGGMTFQKGKDSLKGLSGDTLTKKMESLGMSGFGNGSGNRDISGMGTPPSGDFPGGTNASRRLGNGGGFTNGQIVSLDSQSVTIKQQDGSTKVVYFSSSTAITKSTTRASSDLTVGTEVSATGTSNTDGSVTAQTIRINPVTPNTNSNTNTSTQ